MQSQHSDLMERVETLRLAASRRIQHSERGTRGQFLTPAAVARLMVSLPEATQADAAARNGCARTFPTNTAASLRRN